MQTRDITQDELRTGGYMAWPDGSGPYPGVVVIHEAYGLNDNIKGITRRFADAGYVALAVDLFGGRNRVVCMTRFMAGMLGGAPNRYGVNDLKDALTMLSGLPTVDPKRVGAIGFCLGGGFAIAWACTDSRLRAIAPFYGSNPRPIDAVRRICPVVGSYPEKDFTARAGRSLDKALAGFGIERDIKVYPGARHSFFNATGRAYDREAAEDSWRRVIEFFREHLAAAGR
jgi:carboxymethylenebutenolidase